MTEIEVKFSVLDRNELEELLYQQGWDAGTRFFQKTFSTFKPDYSCAKAGFFMRTRIEDYGALGKKHSMTVKVKHKEDGDYYEREELEMCIEDAELGAKMFQALGFTKLRIFEKYRQTWTKKGYGAEIVIDHLPIGVFMEIEGSKEEIEQIIDELGFSGKERITDSYWRLYEEHTGKKEGDMVFRTLDK